MFNVASIGTFVYRQVNQVVSLSFAIFNGNISDEVGTRGRIFGIVTSMFNINFKSISYIF